MSFLTALCPCFPISIVYKSALYNERNISHTRKLLCSLRLLRFSSMLLCPPSLTYCYSFLDNVPIVLKKLQSVECCRPPDYKLPQIRPRHSTSVRSTLASCKVSVLNSKSCWSSCLNMLLLLLLLPSLYVV